ncbi:CHASE2 domain-containing protein [Phormidium tenue FACHB-886]|nr:CHASE2 domain-containing protein [Phormidium tenue FACHB-886]
MGKRVVLSFGQGNLRSGFPSVTARFGEQADPYPRQAQGQLPAAPDIFDLYRRWQLLYLALHQRLHLRIELSNTGITNVSAAEFNQLCQQLAERIDTWLNEPSFLPIDQKLRSALHESDEIQFILETDDPFLQRLPWHLWTFFKTYRNAEIAISTLDYQKVERVTRDRRHHKVRILAVLGDDKNLDLNADRALLKQLADRADIQFLVAPQRRQLAEQLWQPWDILFFAGHSSSDTTGQLRLNATESLSLEELQGVLAEAIANGLKLAIFNSCDGLSLAQSLASLHIPQVIVMREPVADAVAHQFLAQFLTAFASGQSLYQAVRRSREYLQGIEDEYPCASWLPVLCQNPAEAPVDWQPAQPRDWRLPATLLTSLVTTALVMGIRYFGLLQPWELQAYDQFMQFRPRESIDARLLIVEITEADIQTLPEQKPPREGSLSNLALEKLLKTLHQYRPRAIGLDLYRDPINPNQADLATLIRQDDNFFAICKVSDPESNTPGIPPPPEVPLSRQGFSDFVLDGDNVVRRHLLLAGTNPASPCRAPYAFSVQLAIHYLQAEQIPIDYTHDQKLRMGNVVFEPLQDHQGAYQRADTRGYQILLNYRADRSASEIAPTVTLTDVLRGRLRPEDVRDRIVLIGVKATGAVDRFSTPYSAGQATYQQSLGVEVHAQMISQILSAVQDGRPLIRPWIFWQDVLWIWSWAIAAGGLAISSRSWVLRVAMAGVGGGGLAIMCLWLLVQGVWVPFVPALGAAIATASALIYLSVSNSKAHKRF